jgi:UDP-hydrolysing UDP-N-acetyl-D-glucosamine 2-epimerase
MKRKICIITGSRADYGLLYWLMKEIDADPELELQIVATGMHLSPEHGETVEVIESDGFSVSAKVEMLVSSDTSVGTAKSIGLGVIGFADAFSRLCPDIVVLIGDRFEMFAAAQAAYVSRIPLAHIHGGELTEGAIDEAFRHAMTKMSHYHFVAAEPYRRRVIQLGEHPDRVFTVGAPGLDNITRLTLLTREELESALGWTFGTRNLLVTYHPVTLGDSNPEIAMRALLDALDAFPDVKLIMTAPNADAGGLAMRKLLENYAAARAERVLLATSLGQVKYLSVMRLVDAVVGNSSSGIIEAPLFRIPTVNIGSRQDGRLRAKSVIDCNEDTDSIVKAIAKALDPEFRQSLSDVVSLYGTGHASKAIKEYLKVVPIHSVVKRFYDYPCDDHPKD